ncbi:general substrate transporter [Hypoxylon sp. FL0543]|nr:general substrate transporter [Hypoxylon sp. FL0543]
MVVFSSLAIALYGYDQGIMSLVNTNNSYLRTMGIREDSPVVGIIVSIYYLGCIVGAIMASNLADKRGRKVAITASLVISVIRNLLMFVPGIYPWNSDSTWSGWSIVVMCVGRVVLGLGIGGVDAVVPIYSSELSEDDARGSALAKEFQANIFGLVLAFTINFSFRAPIIFMQIFPILLFSIVKYLPESPRWLISKQRSDDARDALIGLHGDAQAGIMFEELNEAQNNEIDQDIGYSDMIWGNQAHPTVITIMGQINQALTGCGAVSVYGPQVFELLGLTVGVAEGTTLGNYIFYLLSMSLCWMIIDFHGRRRLMLYGSLGLATCYAILACISRIPPEYPHGYHWVVGASGSAVLCLSTAIFGISWLTTVWLIPTEIYPNGARAKGSAISVILFLVFAVTNTISGALTCLFSPETGGRSFEENQTFFTTAREEGTWMVSKVADGKFLRMPKKEEHDIAGGEDLEGEVTIDESAEGEDATSGNR